MADLKPSKYVQRAGWLDPDFLMTLFLPSMGFRESRTEYSFWALWSSPLLVSTDLRNLSKEKRSILTNPEVIAINQDSLVSAGERLHGTNVTGQLWARPLSNGDQAIVLYHPAGLLAIKNMIVSVEWSELGWPRGEQVHVRDLWAQHDLGVFASGYNVSLAPRDVQFLRVSRTSSQLEGNEMSNQGRQPLVV